MFGEDYAVLLDWTLTFGFQTMWNLQCDIFTGLPKNQKTINMDNWSARLADHRGYITNQVLSRATGAHWNLPGHSLADLKVTILEQTKNNCEDYRKEREKFFIRKFDTFNNGLTREVWKSVVLAFGHFVTKYTFLPKPLLEKVKPTLVDSSSDLD